MWTSYLKTYRPLYRFGTKICCRPEIINGQEIQSSTAIIFSTLLECFACVVGKFICRCIVIVRSRFRYAVSSPTSRFFGAVIFWKTKIVISHSVSNGREALIGLYQSAPSSVYWSTKKLSYPDEYYSILNPPKSGHPNQKQSIYLLLKHICSLELPGVLFSFFSSSRTRMEKWVWWQSDKGMLTIYSVSYGYASHRNSMGEHNILLHCSWSRRVNINVISRNGRHERRCWIPGKASFCSFKTVSLSHE